MIVAIIPARGGSKRIPGKNIKPFAGKPLIGYSIEAALKSGLFDHVFVSTDSPEIANVATEFGAEVPFLRSADLADDFTGTDAVVLDTLQRIQEDGILAEYVCCIYATAPFVSPKDLNKGYELLRTSKACSAFTVTTFPAPVFRSLKANDRKRLEMIWPEYRMTRSQDLPEALHDAGQFYWMRVEKLLNASATLTENSGAFEISEMEAQDIDHEIDWELAEIKYNLLHGKG